MEDQIKSFNSHTMNTRIIGLFLTLIAGLGILMTVPAAITDTPQEEDDRVNFIQACKLFETLQKNPASANTNTIKCSQLQAAYDFIKSQESHTPPKAERAVSELAFLVSFFILGLSFVVFADNGLIHHFQLNTQEAFLFKWIGDLKKSKILPTEDSFNQWLKGFEHRYSERDIAVMKLNYKL